MRTLQQIFDAVIVSKCYGQPNATGFMCIALGLASQRGIITFQEERKAKEAVNKWLRDNSWPPTLQDALKSQVYVILPTAPREHAMAIARYGALDIYHRWKARPRATRGSLQATMRHRIICWSKEVRRSYDQS